MDGTGPRGQGPRTGRSIGNCSNVGDKVLRFDINRAQRFGCFCADCSFGKNKQSTKKDQKEALLKERELIEQELKDLESDK
jgi:hypothetical protein